MKLEDDFQEEDTSDIITDELDKILNQEATRTARGHPQALPLPGDDAIETTDALDVQVGGDHYKGMPIQPIQFSMLNDLNACQHTALKYIVRKKGNRLEDIDKAIHTLQIYRQMIAQGVAE